MAIKVNMVKCPECGASLPIEEGRTQFFCSYCGTKVIITNENEYIYRHIDEAEVKQAETDRFVKMRQMESEENDKPLKVKLSIILAIVGTIMVVGGYLIYDAVGYSNSGVAMIPFIGFFVLIAAWRTWPFSKKKKK